jgi:hypothetical protein
MRQISASPIQKQQSERLFFLTKLCSGAFKTGTKLARLHKMYVKNV